MNLINSPRHTRRGFIREGPDLLTFVQPDFPPSRDESSPNQIPEPPVSAVNVIRVDDNERAGVPVEDSDACAFSPEKSKQGARFLSWLAEEIAGQADALNLTEIDICHRVTAKRILASIEATDNQEEYSEEAKRLLSSLQAAVSSIEIDEHDPYLDHHLAGPQACQEPIVYAEEDEDIDLSLELEAHYEPGEEIETPLHIEYRETLRNRARPKPRVEVSPDGQRFEFFAAGSRIVKDVLGRVVEVHSQFGDTLYMHYGPFGSLESIARTDRFGHPHSLGRMEKYGVIMRDESGRVMAAGESMSIDPRGNFYLHSVDGQFFSLDLVSGLHIERRKVSCQAGQVCYATSVFTHDGFRMATMFSRRPCLGTVPGGTGNVHYRFYGRDGTRVDFESDEDLRDLRPSRVAAPATMPVSKTAFKKRQANTAWQSVKEYLMQVS